MEQDVGVGASDARPSSHEPQRMPCMQPGEHAMLAYEPPRAAETPAGIRHHSRVPLSELTERTTSVELAHVVGTCLERAETLRVGQPGPARS
jgi:hypothetical protein